VRLDRLGTRLIPHGKGNLSISLFVLAIALLPFDALPFLPAMYRPLSVYLVLPLFFYATYYYLVSKRTNVPYQVFYFAAFFALTVFVSVVKSYFIGSYAGTIDFVTSFALGMAFFLIGYANLDLLLGLHDTKESFLAGITKVMYPMYFMSLLIGGLQIGGMLFGQIRDMFHVVQVSITEVDQQAVQWFSREPAWGAINVLFFLPFLNYAGGKKTRVLKYALYLEILFSLSLTGYVSLAIILLTGHVLNSREKAKRIAFSAAVALFSIVAVRIVVQEIESTERIIRRLKPLLLDFDFTAFLKFSSSETIRIGFPLAAIREMREDFLLGVGGGNSRFYLAKYLYDIMPWAKYMKEVSLYLKEAGSLVTPRNLYARLLGETGLLGTMLFGLGLGGSYRHCASAFVQGSRERRLCRELFTTILVINLQFDSFALAPLWFGLALLIVLGRPQNGSPVGTSGTEAVESNG
jgi:hypothetical protein